jgi:glutathione S-transferase
MKLYHCVSARSFRPLWLLEELRLAYDLVVMPFPPRVHRKDYFDVNPLGTVPAFQDGDTWMTESTAICEYIAAKHDPDGLGVRAGDPAYGCYLNWLDFGEATLTFPLALILRYSRFEPRERRSPQVSEDYTRWFLARLKGVAAIVEKRDYLCAGRFTAADISVGYAGILAEDLGLRDAMSEATRAYLDRLKARDGYSRARAAERRAAEANGIAAVSVVALAPP